MPSDLVYDSGNLREKLSVVALSFGVVAHTSHCASTTVCTYNRRRRPCLQHNLISAISQSPHVITDDSVILNRSPSKEGNALGQLVDQLNAALAPVRKDLSDAHKAVEFGEYMAKSGENLMTSMNAVAAAPESGDEERIQKAIEQQSEHFHHLQSAIYEFRKRAARALKVAPVEMASLEPVDVETETGSPAP